MCGGHRRKPPSEDNDEEEQGANASTDDTSGFLLSALKPANGKFVLGPRVETEPPVVVFTGPAEKPDADESAVEQPAPKKKRARPKAATAKK
jgi:hypothetical protein